MGLGALDTPSFYRAIVRVSGLAYRLPAEELKTLWQINPDYFLELQRRTGIMLSHLAQRAICINYHTLEQQLVRWMILMLDRLWDDVIPVTHSELASLIGNRREGVTLALGSLAKRNLIEMQRGSIRVPDRTALEMISCDCYWNAQGKTHPALSAALNRSRVPMKTPDNF